MNTDLRSSGKFLVHNLEAIVWIAAIIVFALSPLPAAEHFSICPLSLAGFEHCPGCGLGRAMTLLLHGRVSESISMHPFAIPALALFATRILIVFKNYFNFQKQITPKTT
jgi:hypothetical protein